jgi:hypothetical protein
MQEHTAESAKGSLVNPDPAADPRLSRIVRLLILRSFPLLRRLKLTTLWGVAEDELLSYTVQSDHYLIRVNDSLRPAATRVLQGGIAHELCHIDADIRIRGYQRQLAWDRYMQSRWRRMLEERATDRRVIELGYGPHLLAFVRFAHRLGHSFSREHGLLYAEICRETYALDNTSH